jgi:hypothetical protein
MGDRPEGLIRKLVEEDDNIVEGEYIQQRSKQNM